MRAEERTNYLEWGRYDCDPKLMIVEAEDRQIWSFLLWTLKFPLFYNYAIFPNASLMRIEEGAKAFPLSVRSCVRPGMDERRADADGRRGHARGM